MTDSRVTRASRTPPVFQGVLAALVLVLLLLEYVLPWVAVWLGLRAIPAPIPAFAKGIYLLCALVGALAFVGSDDRRWEQFVVPLWRWATLAPGPGRTLRVLVHAALPLAVGAFMWNVVAPTPHVPAVIRLQHPTLPEKFAARSNPLGVASDDEIRRGIELYQKNCRPCHGVAADGAGPLARGLRLRPIDFTDPGTIASVVESYPFWRVTEGGRGLPDIATPWNSAMPAWGAELTEDEIWHVVMTAYRISGTEPRRPEGSPR